MIYTLAAEQVSAPVTQLRLSPITGLDDMQIVTLDVSFLYGTGGTSCILWVETTFDHVNWRPLARFEFTTATVRKYANISCLTSKSITILNDLGIEGINDALLGDQLRAVITSTGTYSNTTLSVRANVR